jgi:2-oxoisovalerate dehydrogenase E2 component (dihydrolipoyl transacylase)
MTMVDVCEFMLPDLAEGLEEGEVVEWFVSVGDDVALNQVVASIETAKAVVELPSPFEGRVTDICAEAGETLKVGSVLMRVGVGRAVTQAVETGEIAEASESAALEDEAGPKPLVGYGAAPPTSRRRRRRATGPGPTSTARLSDSGASTPAPDLTRATPRAVPLLRKLATEHGIDLHSLAPGSGPEGRITRRDLEEALAARSAAQLPTTRAATAETAFTEAPTVARRVGFRGRYPGEVEQVKGIRKHIIAKMEHSRRTIPDAACGRDTDVTALWELRSTLTKQASQEGLEARITPLALISRATVLALRRFPTLNSRYDEEAGEIRLLEDINLGVAVDTEAGLMVPNIKNAERLSVLELSEKTARLAARCRDRQASPEELTGGTFTVNNYGYFGNDDGAPIINAPESAILGIGAIRERPWVVDGQLTVRRIARLQLVFDHRVCDGGEAGRFIDHLARLCEEPSRLLLHS